jgi:hypothetical protein
LRRSRIRGRSSRRRVRARSKAIVETELYRVACSYNMITDLNSQISTTQL